MLEDLEPHQVAQRLASDSPPLLLDVRETWEVRVAAIPGSVHLPMAEIPARHDELPDDRTIVVVCHHGSRSRQVATWLATQGHTDVANLAGGLDTWAREVDPTVPRY
ncbi:rhodanese-like domain-containing protein [soil metagenome]